MDTSKRGSILTELHNLVTFDTIFVLVSKQLYFIGVAPD